MRLVRLIVLSMFVLASMGGVVAVGPAAAAPPTAITSCPFVITAPGHYVLVTDCTGSGITIAASDVVLKLNGHTISNAPGDSILATDVNRVRIEGPGTITGCNFSGVNFQHAVNDSLVKNVSVSGCNDGPGVRVDSSHGDRFSEVVSTGNANEGFLQSQSSSMSYVNDSANNNNFDGIFLISSSATTVDQTTANGNGSLASGFFEGIRVDRLSSDIHLEGNTANSNSDDGIRIELGSTQNTIIGNTALGNTVFDLFDGNLVPPCDTNTWAGNQFATANQSCIH